MRTFAAVSTVYACETWCCNEKIAYDLSSLVPGSQLWATAAKQRVVDNKIIIFDNK